MDSNIVLAGLALVVLFYLVVAFFAAKTWQVVHVLLLVAVFFAAGGFLVLATMTLTTRQRWCETAQKLQTKVDKMELEASLTEKGYSLDAKGKLQEIENSLKDVKAELSRELYDRGRVWWGTMPGEVVDTGIEVTLNSSEAAVAPDAEGAAPPARVLEPKTILYAFEESEIDGQYLPTLYVAEFKVTGVDGNRIILSPTLPLDANQQEYVRNSRGRRWTLYEIMPVDSREHFAELYNVDAADPQTDFRAKLEFLMPRAKVGANGYEALIDEYVYDFRPADSGQAPPERVWKKVKFLKPHKIEVNAEGEPPRFPVAYFDSEGRAIPSSLRLRLEDKDTEEIKFIPCEFEVGDIAKLEREAAIELIEDGICVEVEELYVRELRDYDYLFRALRGLMQDVAESSRTYTAKTKESKDLESKKKFQFDEYTGTQTKLVEDRDFFKAELQAMAAYGEQLEEVHRKMLARIKKLERDNYAMATVIDRSQKAAAAAIDRRTGPVAPSVPAAPRVPATP